MGAFAYLNLPKLWTYWPSLIDTTFNITCSGVIAAFPFYLVTVFWPQVKKKKAAIAEVRERLKRLNKTIDCYFNTINISPVGLEPNSSKYVSNYTGLGQQKLEFSMFYYPYSARINILKSHGEFVQELAINALAMLREIKLLLPNEVGPLNVILNRAESLCLQIRDTSFCAMNYALLGPNLREVILAFEREYPKK